MSFVVNVNLGHSIPSETYYSKLACRFQLLLGVSRTLIYKYKYLLRSAFHRTYIASPAMFNTIIVSFTWCIMLFILNSKFNKVEVKFTSLLFICFTPNSYQIYVQCKKNNESKFRHTVSSKIKRYIHTLELVTDLILSLKTGENHCNSTSKTVMSFLC